MRNGVRGQGVSLRVKKYGRHVKDSIWYVLISSTIQNRQTDRTDRQRTKRQMQRLTVSDRACKYRAVRYTPLRWPLAALDTP